eukprot:g2859.t1
MRSSSARWISARRFLSTKNNSNSSWIEENVRKGAYFKEKAYVGGEWVSAQSGSTFQVLDPGSGNVLGVAPDMDENDTFVAIQAARTAFTSWSTMTASARAVLLERWYENVMEHEESLAALITAECGKPIAEARGEVKYGASFLKWFAEEGRRANGQTIPTDNPNRRLLTMKQAVGVCGLITPWNFPNAMITRKAGPALAAGCTVVIKPAEDTPFSALALAAAAEEAGIPPGVVNVITSSRAGTPSVGNAICSSEDVRKVSFTGSTAVGKHLAALCANTVKRTSLELGGNAPFIVFDDADIDAAIAGAVASKFRNTGQTCVCANRFIVQSAIHDEFASRLTAAVEAMRQGHGQDDTNALGPLINKSAVDKVERHVSDAVERGATVLTGGSKESLVLADGGHFYPPTIVTGVDRTMVCWTEETFGPLAPIYRFETEEEAVALANDTNAGLAAYFYTRDAGRIFRVSEALEYGMVGANEGVISTVLAPFGGVKESGIGREGASVGLDEYTEEKYICVGGIS